MSRQPLQERSQNIFSEGSGEVRRLLLWIDPGDFGLNKNCRKIRAQSCVVREFVKKAHPSEAHLACATPLVVRTPGKILLSGCGGLLSFFGLHRCSLIF